MEDIKLTVNTRNNWAQWHAGGIDAASTTARMIDLGTAEFLRYNGILTVEITVQDETRTRRMVWRGTEEVLT